jgi:hypothetical protein
MFVSDYRDLLAPREQAVQASGAARSTSIAYKAPEFQNFAQADATPRAIGAELKALSTNVYVNALQFRPSYIWKFPEDSRVITYLFDNDGDKTWSVQQKGAFRSVLTEISNVIDLSFVEVHSMADNPNLVETFDHSFVGASHDILDENSDVLIGRYNLVSDAENQEIYLGSYDYNTFLHEIGHALGLEHPFAEHPFPGGVFEKPEILGDNNFIHTMHTMMAYRSVYTFDGEGRVKLDNTDAYLNGQKLYGYPSTLGVFDIMALGEFYGYNKTYRSDRDFYEIVDKDISENDVLSWVTIYDTGGVDEIRYSGERKAFIDLRAATGDNTPTGGGLFSHAANVYGGYSIAKGVLIENATGGSGDDEIIGNDSGNILTGGAGRDVLTGGRGNDIFAGTAAELEGDTVTDLEFGDHIWVKDADGSLGGLSYLGETLSFTSRGVDVELFVRGDGTAGILRQRASADGAIEIYFERRSDDDGPGGGGTGTPPVNPPDEPAPFVPVEIEDPTPDDGFNEASASASFFAFFNDAAPSEEKLQSLNEFANSQYEYYKGLGVANPALGPYEAFGRAFADTPEFIARYGDQSEAVFIAEAYLSVFGRAPSTAQQAHFQSQIDYFQALYEGAGISDQLSEQFAKGVALGQMIGFVSLFGLDDPGVSPTASFDFV